jgi:hypothetical protein
MSTLALTAPRIPDSLLPSAGGDVGAPPQVLRR